jgi:hypothetical protein
LHIPDVVARGLLAERGLGPTELAIFLAVWTSQPGNLSALSEIVGASRNTTTRACDNLVARGWLRLVPDGKRLRPEALIPHCCQELMVQSLKEAYEMAANRGEFLMKRYLDLRVNSDDYVNNARPVVLTNPGTGEPMEYDRLYLTQGVAFEFNGPQHYETTKRYNNEWELKQTKLRDLVKTGISYKNNIALIVVTMDELHPDILETLIPASLPRRPLDTTGCYYRALAGLCAAYGAKARSSGK